MHKKIITNQRKSASGKIQDNSFLFQWVNEFAPANITTMEKNRRTFLKTAAVAGTALAVKPFQILGAASPNSKITVAVMGVKSRGKALAKRFAQLPNTEVAMICDVDSEYMEIAQKEVAENQKRTPKGEKDIRKVLEDKSIDALVIAAPDHWHAPAAIMAVQAGKHVYVEKPCSHNPREGELLIAAQKKYNRVIHMGNQRRSWPNIMKCMDDLHAGMIGEVYFARGWYNRNRESIGFGKVCAPPAKLDFDLWQGPAPRTDYRDNIHPYNWHWFRRWGTGEALNNGTHMVDLMRWGLEVDYPSRVVSAGGRFAYQDDWEFPDTHTVLWDFEGGKSMSWESRSCSHFKYEGNGVGVIFHGTKGTCVIKADDYTMYARDRDNSVIKAVSSDAEKDADDTNTVSPVPGLENPHLYNFLQGIRDGIKTNSPIDEGHKSVLLCQLGNIAWMTGRALNIDQRNGHIIGDNEAMKHWSRTYEPGWEPKV